MQGQRWCPRQDRFLEPLATEPKPRAGFRSLASPIPTAVSGFPASNDKTEDFREQDVRYQYPTEVRPDLLLPVSQSPWRPSHLTVDPAETLKEE